MQMDEEPKITYIRRICPKCGAPMSDISGLGLDNQWRESCSKRCGYINVIGHNLITLNKEKN